MADKPASDIDVGESWVTVTEAAEKTGYHRDYVQKLAHRNWNLPEDHREIQIRRHSHGYMVWLPNLIDYLGQPGKGRGPRSK
jgi:hypothetical protein